MNQITFLDRVLNNRYLNSHYIANIRDAVKHFYSFIQWCGNSYSPPYPIPVKQSVLARHSKPSAVWIETGTFRGDTTFFLSNLAKQVHSIEPAVGLYSAVCHRFRNNQSVFLYNNSSEKILGDIIQKLSGDLCVWLDGHYSGGVTFLGPDVTPILAELDIIDQYLDQFTTVNIFIDDIRLFGNILGGDSEYPTFETLINWLQQREYVFFIESDIMIIRSTKHQ